MKSLLLSLLVCLTASFTFADEMEPGQELNTIVGTKIDMKIYDHAMAGSIKDYVAWGFFDESEGVAELIVRKYGQTIKTAFKEQDGKVGSVILHRDNGVTKETTIFLKKLDPANHLIVLEINGQEVAITVMPEMMNEHHLVNPTFKTVVNGQEVSYKMGGQACYGKSMFFAMMILGAYVH